METLTVRPRKSVICNVNDFCAEDSSSNSIYANPFDFPFLSFISLTSFTFPNYLFLY